MDAQTAARLLGGRARGNRVSCPGPGHSKSDQSLTVVFTPTGFVVHSFSTTDDWKECKDYVRTKLGISDDWKPDPAKFHADTSPDNQHFEYAMDIWERSRPAIDTLAQKYLASRHISLPEEILSIRFHPSLKFDGGRHPGMVCLYRDIITNEPRGVHRTFLRPDASKIDRKMLGPAKGAAIKLDENDTVTLGITIGEGVETCMSARQLGYAPTWAVMSAQGIRDFPVLSGLSAITYLGERDDHGANEAAVRANARLQLAAGIDAILKIPETGDINTVISE